MAAFTTIAAATSVALSAGSAIQAGSEKKAAREAAKAQADRIRQLEGSRQQIINPYENIKDLSSMVSNPFANLQVATRAAEMKARETDISLAQTLDTLRATGAAAGGATALAQAAARSKQDVAATIEQQEAQNARLRAQGEAQMQQLRMQEAARVQQAGVAGQQFMFGVREQREMQELNRAAGLQAQYQQSEMAARASQMAALGSMAGNLMTFAANTYEPSRPKVEGIDGITKGITAPPELKINAPLIPTNILG